MYSQGTNRMFSQNMDLSQPSGQFENAHDEHNNYETDQTSQHASDNQLSSRAEAICNENRHINYFVERNLKALERQRSQLANDVASVKKVIQNSKEIQERESKKCLELQMDLEQWTMKYQVEISERPKLTEKLSQLESIVTCFEDHLNKGITVGEETKELTNNIHDKFEESLKKNICVMRSKLKNKYIPLIEKEIQESRQIKQNIIEKREESLSKIQGLASHNMEKANLISNLESMIEQKKISIEEKTSLLLEITKKKQLLTEEHSKLHQEHEELVMENASCVQDLKIKINNEENQVQNLETKLEEKGDLLNSLLVKLNGKSNLFNQIKNSIDEISQRNQTLLKKINELKASNKNIIEETSILSQEIKLFEHVESDNLEFKNTLAKLQEEIALKKITIAEKEVADKNLLEKLVEEKATLLQIQKSIKSQQSELVNIICDKEDVLLQSEQDKTHQQQERENKLMRYETLKTEASNLKDGLNNVNKDLELKEKNNTCFKQQQQELKLKIEQINDCTTEVEEKLVNLKEEWERTQPDEMLHLYEYEQLEKYKTLLDEINPVRSNMQYLRTKKNVLEQELKTLNEKHKIDEENLHVKMSSKIMELKKERDNYSSIMEKLLFEEIDKTEKYMEEIKNKEMLKNNLEEELKELVNQYKRLKYNEMNKRSKVARMEKRLRAINKEIKITSQDIADAIVGKSKEVSGKMMLPPPTRTKPNMKDDQFENKLKPYVYSAPNNEEEYEYSEI